MGKAVALLGESNSCLTGLAGDILVAVQHDLRGERRMAAYFNGDVSPLGVQNVKGIVVDIRHRLLFLDVVIGADIPHRRLGPADQDKPMIFTGKKRGWRGASTCGVAIGHIGNLLVGYAIRQLSHQRQRSEIVVCFSAESTCSRMFENSQVFQKLSTSEV